MSPRRPPLAPAAAGSAPGAIRPGWPERLALAVALLYPVAFLVVALLRLPFPFELEWMEGSMVTHVSRVREGLPLYVAPSLSFTPFIYPPLYFWLSAALSVPLGEGFVPLRLLSIVSAVGGMACIALAVRSAGGGLAASLLGASLFAACFREGGAWLDLGRVDALCLALLLAGAWALRASRRPLAAGIVAGLLFALASLTKQSALFVAAPVAAALLAADRRRLAGFLVGLVPLAGGAAWALDRASDGWYRYYLFDLPRHHPIIGQLLRGFWVEDLLGPVGIALAVGSAHFFIGRAPARARWVDAGFVVGMILSAYLTRVRVGSFENVVLPAYAAAGLLFGLGLAAIERAGTGLPERARRRTGRWVAFLCLVQFAVLAYKPWLQVPGRADVEAGNQVVESLRRVSGEVWVPAHPYLAERAGKPPHAHQLALVDVLRGGETPQHRALVDSLRASLARHRWAVIVLDGEGWVKEEVSPHYEQTARMFSENEPRLFWPATGFYTRPDFVWTPRAAGQP